jgi:hypothetical protein
VIRRLLVVVAAATALGSGSQARSAPMFRTSHAIVVGLDDYASLGLEPLSNAESDARAVEDYLKAQGYQVTPLIGRNASKQRVEHAVAAIATVLGKDDRFLFFFAGHGQAKQKEGVDIAYLVLRGGANAEDRDSLISTGDIHEYSRQLDAARHQLFVFDSCYAGLMGEFRSRSGDRVKFSTEDSLVEHLSQRRVRQYLSAGGPDQEVLDNGAAKLSWFTYFLRKGLEPGQVSRRQSGVITFSELASYVQVMSANPKHTPAFGSLAGHGGGEYLLLTTAKGKPVLPRLRDVTIQTLRDLGFLTRSDSPRDLAPLVETMRKPIDDLFDAWRRRDVDAYLRQFDPKVVQTGRYKSGGTYERGLTEIARNRRALFARLGRVEVGKYEVMYQGGDQKRAVFGVRYSMDFEFTDGTKPKSEHGINECYVVEPHESESRWVIVRNDDYLARLCEQ